MLQNTDEFEETRCYLIYTNLNLNSDVVASRTGFSRGVFGQELLLRD